MRLHFWQPIPSFHQEGFLNALANAEWVECVSLHYESDIPETLKTSGWPQAQWAHVHADPISENSFPDDDPEVVHFFTGFRTHRKVWRVFDRLAPQRKARVYAYTEAPALCGWKAPLRRFKYRWHARRLCGQLDAVLAVGGKGERFYRSILGDDVPVHRFAYYDLPESKFPPLIARRPNALVELLFVGRLIHLKGLDRLFHALAAVAATTEWRLTILGGGPEKARLQSLADSLDLSHRIRWIPAVPSAEVAPFYQESDFLIQPSRGDGWGMTIPEALRHGCEVIATEACGAADLARPEFRLSADEAAWPGIFTQALNAGPLNHAQRQQNQQRARAYSAEAGVERLRRILAGSRGQGTGSREW